MKPFDENQSFNEMLKPYKRRGVRGFGAWSRRCKRCQKIYKTTAKRSRICDDCKKFTGRYRKYKCTNEVQVVKNGKQSE